MTAVTLSLALAGAFPAAADASQEPGSSVGRGGPMVPGLAPQNRAPPNPAPPNPAPPNPAPNVPTPPAPPTATVPPPALLPPLPPPASWRTSLVSPVASLGRYYAWLTRSRIPQPPGVVGFEIGGCYGGNGCIDWADPPVVRLAPWARKLRSTFYHEIGHVFDYYVLEPAGYRDSFLPLVRRPTYDRLATERFADAYMLCAQSGHLRKTVVTRYYRYKATPAIHRSACNLIRGVASIRYQQSLQGAAQTQ